jgi:DNA-binding response OmpR family regulator
MNSILFLDGHHAQRSVLAECLRNDGYAVLEAADLTEAERACDEYDAPIDLAILDAEAGIGAGAKLLAGKYPSMKVLYVSGPEWKTVLHLHRISKSRWLEKPFAYEALVRSVRAILSQSRHAPGSQRVK